MPYVLPREAATVRTDAHGDFHLNVLSMGAARELAAIDTTLAPREYCVQVLLVVVQAPPECSVEALRALPDTVLRQLVRAFAASPHGLDKPLPAKQPVFIAFKAAVRGYLIEEVKRLQETFAGIRSSLDAIMAPVTAQLTSSLLPALPAFHPGTLAALQAFTPPPLVLPDFDSIIPRTTLTALSQSVTDMTNIVAGLPVSPLGGMAPALATLQQSTYWAQQSRDYLADIARIAAGDLAAAHLAPLFTAASDMSLSFGSYLDGIRGEWVDRPAAQRTLGADVVLPAQTSAIALRTVKIIGDRASAGDRASRASAPVTTTDQLRSHLDGYLHRVSPRFVGQWHGAWEALESTNPDRLRQAAHSGRELLAQVLHELAPDGAFSADELKLRKDGKPTRKMRVAKILGTNAGSTTVALIEAQARLADEMYQALSATAHSHEPIMDEREVGGYLMCLDGILLFLLARVLRLD